MGDASGRWLTVWTAIAILMLGVGVGGSALIEPDEGRNATIAADMASTGDFVVPRLEGLPYLDKPVLFFASIAGSLELFGSTELAVRLPALLASWLTVGLVWWFGARVLGRGAGVVAALATATAPLFLAFARIAIFDSTLSLFVCGSLLSFYLAVERAEERRWVYAAWTCMALGVLTKGPVAIAVPLLVALPWALWRGRVGRAFSPGAVLAFAATVTPWVVAVEHELPGFLRYVLVTETWQRVTSDALERSEPWWFFVPFVLAGFFPWSVVAIAGRPWRPDPAPGDEESARRGALRIYLVLWVIVPFLLFSLSSSKQPQYVLPLAPAVALLAASGWRAEGAGRGALAGAVGWLILAAPLLLAGLQVIPVDTRVDAETSAGIYRTGLLLGGAALIAAAATGVAVRLGRARDAALVALSLPLVLFPWITAESLGEIAEIRSSRGVAAELAARMGPDDRLIAVDSYSPTLSFYLGRRQLVSTEDGAPFRANYVIHRYDDLVDDTAGSLRSGDWWRQALAECLASAQPGEDTGAAGVDYFVVDRGWSDAGAELEAAGLERFHRAFRLDAYGPCGGASR